MKFGSESPTLDNSSSMHESRYRFVFDERERLGSSEHFWHFIFGYFLPILSSLLDKHLYDQSPPPIILVNDCGPKMNLIMTDTMRFLGIEVRFKKGLNATTADSWLTRFHNRAKAVLTSRGVSLDNEYRYVETERGILLPRWDIRLDQNRTHPTEFFGDLLRLREAIQSKAPAFSCCHFAEQAKNPEVLILKRSSPPAFYLNNGDAERKGYGTARRALVGLEEAAQVAEERGMRTLVYEPGAHNIACQIVRFGRCRGVLAIRGSELANMFWVPTDTTILMLNPEKMRHTPPQRALAKLLGLNLVELKIPSTKEVVLSEGHVLRFVREVERRE
jgi:hypothetical protein